MVLRHAIHKNGKETAEIISCDGSTVCRIRSCLSVSLDIGTDLEKRSCEFGMSIICQDGSPSSPIY